MPLEFREKIIANIRKKTLENAKLLSELAVEETGMGNVGHKIIKHQLVAEKTPGTEDLSTIAWSGDRGLTLTEMGPWGVIGAVCPSTNPTCTVICNSIGMLAAGNAVVSSPHPSAKNCSNLAIDMVNRASIEVGGPENIVTAVAEPTMDVSNYIFKHKDIDMLCATGGPGVVTAVLSSGKRAMGAGAGNPPVLVDETANIPKAAEDIINGCTFDNNLPCIAEKEVVVVDTVADELIYHMEQNGCYHASPEEFRNWWIPSWMTRTVRKSSAKCRPQCQSPSRKNRCDRRRRSPLHHFRGREDTSPDLDRADDADPRYRPCEKCG